jgi:lysyl-tRNA synthetase class II
MKESIVKVTLLTLLIASGLLFASIPAFAHHSFGSTYDVQKEIELAGKVVQVSLRSPHSFFYIEAKDENGQVQRWAIEGAGAAQFAQQGVTRDSFKIGDLVQVIGNPARSKESFRARLVKITRPSDGKSWGSRAGEVVD